jgi:hypothetical protein
MWIATIIVWTAVLVFFCFNYWRYAICRVQDREVAREKKTRPDAESQRTEIKPSKAETPKS